MKEKMSKNKMRKIRHKRVRKQIIGTSLIPRLNVYKSNNNIFVQLIDDEKGVTLASASSIDKELKLANGKNTEAGKKVGELIANRIKDLKISNIVFDRGGYLYHGVIKALAETVRSKGIEF